MSEMVAGEPVRVGDAVAFGPDGKLYLFDRDEAAKRAVADGGPTPTSNLWRIADASERIATTLERLVDALPPKVVAVAVAEAHGSLPREDLGIRVKEGIGRALARKSGRQDWWQSVREALPPIDPVEVSKLTEGELLEIKNFGETSLSRVKHWLSTYGLSLRKESP